MSQSEENKKTMALRYHEKGRPGKIEVIPTKPCLTSSDLSLAYSPGVAHPCTEIAEKPDEVYKYTAKGNLVAVVSNGTAVLGLGNIGPLASKPVMEGKGILFKKFADIDVYDIEVDQPTVEGMVNVVKSLEPTFGGVNLEDIKAPECFEIEKQLIEKMNIPVFHDDQHGTAIIASAGLLNALEIVGKKASEVKLVMSGAGAASISCARLFKQLGVKPENLYMTDSKGIIYKGRTSGMNEYKEEFANDTDARTLEDAMKDADVFMGLSAKGILTPQMVGSMAKDPIIFAMANPDPEILPEQVKEVRDDAIMATGRSDYPNQVNNVLGFPFIFRGALDVRAKKINEEMKMAAVRAIAQLAKEEVPEEVQRAYGDEKFSFGREYLIPKPFDKRVLLHVAPAVAQAAVDSGVARNKITDYQTYVRDLESRLGSAGPFMNSLRSRLPREKSRIVFPEGTNTRILYACNQILQDNKITPILLGDTAKIHQRMEDLGLAHLKDLEIIDPELDARYLEFVSDYHEQRKRKGISHYYAEELLLQPNYFGSMLVKKGLADGLVTGATRPYPDCIDPIFKVVGSSKNMKAAGVMILLFKNKIIFFADCTVQPDPSARDLSHIAKNTADLYKMLLKKDPNIAFLSFSNFGSTNHASAQKVKQAVEITKMEHPDLNVDGELQADVAVNETLRKRFFDFSTLKEDADILIFPDLNSSNIAYKLLYQLAEATALGPILTPMNEPVHIVQRTSTVEEIVHMSTITALIAHEKANNK